jgi:hypothetical protein
VMVTLSPVKLVTRSLATNLQNMKFSLQRTFSNLTSLSFIRQETIGQDLSLSTNANVTPVHHEHEQLKTPHKELELDIVKKIEEKPATTQNDPTLARSDELYKKVDIEKKKEIEEKELEKTSQVKKLEEQARKELERLELLKELEIHREKQRRNELYGMQRQAPAVTNTLSIFEAITQMLTNTVIKIGKEAPAKQTFVEKLQQQISSQERGM